MNKKKLIKAISNLQYTVNNPYALNLQELLVSIAEVLLILAPKEFDINLSTSEALPIISKIINRDVQDGEQILPVAKELVIAAKRYI